MAFTRSQGSGKYQTDNAAGTSVTYSAGLANFTAGRLLVSSFAHYAGNSAIPISGCAYNTTDTAIERVVRQNPTNTVNRISIFDLLAVVTTGAHNTTLSFAAADHYITGSTTEFSYSGTASVVGSATADGNSGAPSVTTPAGTQTGDLIVAAFVMADASDFTVTSSPSGSTVEWSEGTTSAHQPGEGVTKVAATGGAQAMTWAISNSQHWSAVVAVYRDSGGGGSTSDSSESAAQRQVRQNAVYRMSPRSEREAQQFLRAQKRAYGFAAPAA